jgi:hypothetical protein
LLDRIVPLLRERNIAFKVVRNESTLSRLNEGLLGGTQIGKVVTVYPDSDAQAGGLAAELCELTSGLRGPRVATDRKLGDIVYARFGGLEPVVRRDRLGHLERFVRDPQGRLRLDRYTVPFEAPAWVQDPFPRPDLEQPERERTHLLGDRYLLLETIKASPKGSVFLALDLYRRTDVRLVVLKEGRAHCVEDSAGRDMRARLRRQERLHRQLANVARVPAAGNYFEVDGNGYLPLDYVSGQTVESLAGPPWHALDRDARRDTVGLLFGVATAIGQLHALGVIHRDLAPTNVQVADDGEIWLLDLELAHDRSRSELPFEQGTPGFAAPEQVAGTAPTPAADVYAFGSLCALLLTGLDPRRIHHARSPDPTGQLVALSGAPLSLASLVAACIAPAEPSRPQLDQVLVRLNEARAEVGRPGTAMPRRTAMAARGRRFASFAAAGAQGLLSGVHRDPASGLWLSHVSGPSGAANQPLSPEYEVYRSASRGVAGVVYALSRLRQLGRAPEAALGVIADAVDWLLAHHPTADDQMPGLHFGEAGVATAITEALASGAIASGPWVEPYLREALNGPLDWPDVTHGAAGQGLAVLLVADRLTCDSILRLSDRCTSYLLGTQREDGSWALPDGVDGMSGVRYTGFAHGTAGIVYFLTEYASRFDSEPARKGALAAADWLAAQARPTATDGSLAWPMRAGEAETWHWWCHGAPGIALAFLHLYERFGDERHAELADRALRSVPGAVRSSNLSQCHGLAGLIETYLEAERVLQNRSWRERAESLGDVIVNLAAGAPPHPATWLVEDPFRPTGDLMVGCGGVALALLRLAREPGPAGPPLLLTHDGN